MPGLEAPLETAIRKPPRAGPRPLPTHLLTAAMTYTSSNAALPLLRNGSLNSSLATDRIEAFNSAADRVDALDLARAVETEGRARIDDFLRGVSAYRSHSYQRDVEDPAAVWSEGSTRLLKYPATSGTPKADLFVVPSLINRAYVLDLSSRSSFMRWITAHGYNGYLVDWGRPGPTEESFDLTDYIAGRLARAFHAIEGRVRRPTFSIGYCMGGDLALAHALRHQNDVSGLALLATPWDFHAADAVGARAISAMADAFEPQLTLLGALPTDFLQLLFCTLDPLLGFRKFQKFANLDPVSDRALDFVALEDWLNDGVPLTAKVARECLGNWYGQNTTARGDWRIDGEPVRPAALSIPALAVIPAHDRIVPPESARALADALPECETLSPAAGHIGMMTGRNAETAVWRPLTDWINAQCQKML